MKIALSFLLSCAVRLATGTETEVPAPYRPLYQSLDAALREARHRDNFSFWAPLDARFLGLLLGIAQQEHLSVVCPCFSQYLFAYDTFGEAESSALPP